jgi:WD40 repeat protein
VWDAAAGRPLRVLQEGLGDASAVAVSADGAHAAAGSSGGLLRLWRVASGELLREWKAAGGVLDLAFHPNGRQLASAHRNQAVRLWEVPSGAAGLVLRPPAGDK